MTDILLTKGRDRTTVEGVTEKGVKWLKENIGSYKNVFTISNEFVEDFKNDLPKDISVDEVGRR